MIKKDLHRLRKTSWIWIALLLGLVSLQGCAGIKSDFDYEQGLNLFQKQQYRAAHEYALAAHAQQPENLQYDSLLGWTWLKQGNTREAEALFSTILRTQPDNISGIQGMAWVHYEKKEYRKARAFFEKDVAWAKDHMNSEDWIDYDSKDKLYVQSILSDAYYGFGLIDVAGHKYGRAATAFQEAAAYPNSFMSTAVIKTALASAYYSGKRYHQAGKIYKELIRSDWSNSEAVTRLLWCIQRSGNDLASKELLSDGMRRAADKRPFLLGMAIVSRMRNDKKQMQRYFLMLVQRYPDYVEKVLPGLVQDRVFWKNYIDSQAKQVGMSYYEHGEFESALRQFRIYLHRSPGDGQALITAAWCKLYLGQYQDSLAEFSRLSRKAGVPKDQALIGKAVSILYLGRLDEADAIFRDVIRRFPQNVRARVDLGAIAYLKGDYTGAIRIYTANLGLLPKHDSIFSWPSHALNNLGWSYYYTRRYAQALEIFKRLETYHPQAKYPVIYNGIGWSYLRLNQKKESRQAFRKSLTIDPENRSALAGLAELAR
jgi:tetratricopeptide (TPR) repeat protein